MRVALVGDEYPPLTGGVATYAAELSSFLSKLGVEVVVFTREGAEEREGVEVRGLKGFSVKNRFLSPFTFAELRRYLRSGDFSVVHGVDMYSSLALAASRFARGKGIPSVLTCHSVHSSSGFWKAAYLPLSSFLKRASRVVAVSGASKEFCLSLGVPEEKIRVIPNGVDLSLFHEGVDGREFRRRVGVGDGERLVATAIRLVKRKGPYLLLKAFEEVSREVPEVKLVIAGEGPEEGRLRREVEREGLKGRVKMLGRLPYPEVAKLMAGADVFVLPSSLEAFGLAAVEAMAVGTPVVCPRAGGILEFAREGYNCLFFEPGNPSSLKEVLLKLLSDSAMIKNLRRGGLETARKFTWEKTAELTLRLYEEIA
ncbi:MAG: glycosyltransferase family 4 protein [Candidatus Hadarchaeales archaeon]